MSEVIYIMMYIICNMFIGFQMISNKIYYSDARGVVCNINTIDILLLLFIYIATLIATFYLYKKISKKRIIIKSFPKIEINHRKADVFFFVILISNYAFFLITGIGKVLGTNSSRYSFIFSMFDISCLFGIYYILRRKNFSILFWINIIGFSIYRLSQGWSSFLMQILLYEIYNFSKYVKKSSTKKIFQVLFPILLILLGGAVYCFVSPIKNAIRYNSAFWNILPYSEGLTLLTERISNFSNFAYTLFYNNEIIESYQSENIAFKEIKCIFRAVLPSFFYETKDMININTAFTNSQYPNVTTSSVSFMILGYIFILFKADFISGLFWVILLILFFVLYSSLLYSIEEYKGQYNILLFFYMIGFYLNGSLEQIVRNNFKIIFFIPLLFLFNIIEKKKVNLK